MYIRNVDQQNENLLQILEIIEFPAQADESVTYAYLFRCYPGTVTDVHCRINELMTKQMNAVKFAPHKYFAIKYW